MEAFEPCGLPSPDEFRKSAKVCFRTRASDSAEASSRTFLDENQDKLLAIMQKQWPGIWNVAHRLWSEDRSRRIVDSFFVGEFLVKAEIAFDRSLASPLISFTVGSPKWAKRHQQIQDIFANEPLLTQSYGYPIVVLCARLPVAPSLSFRVVRDFDPTNVRDNLGLEIDQNIRNLVRYLNMIDLETTQSCGGHPEDGRFPWIDFKVDALEGIIALMQVWREAGGLEYEIAPVYREDEIQTIRLRAVSGASLLETQRDLNSLSDYLESKLISDSSRSLKLISLIGENHTKLKKLLIGG
jgi:hypothetical protein